MAVKLQKGTKNYQKYKFTRCNKSIHFDVNRLLVGVDAILSVTQLKMIQITCNVHNIQNCFMEILTTKNFNSVSDSESFVYINPKCCCFSDSHICLLVHFMQLPHSEQRKPPR